MIYNYKQTLEQIYKESNIERGSNLARILRGNFEELSFNLSKRSAQVGDLKNKLIKAQQDIIELKDALIIEQNEIKDLKEKGLE